MKYRLKQKDGSIDVVVSELEGNQEAMLEAFAACRAGRCSCPTQEYRKLAALEILPDADGIRLQLRAQPGEALDAAEIERCLTHTARAIDSSAD